MAVKSGVIFGIRVEKKSLIRVMGRIVKKGSKIEQNIFDALDETAALAQNHARAGHPKAKLRGTDEEDESLRVKSGPASGPFAGKVRFLTRTGGTRLSIQIRRAHRTMNTIQSELYSALKHSDELEFGTAKKRAFPFIRPAAYSVMLPMRSLLARATKRGLEQG